MDGSNLEFPWKKPLAKFYRYDHSYIYVHIIYISVESQQTHLFLPFSCSLQAGETLTVDR